MPLFIYKAKKEDALTVTGEITARDAEEAVELVSRQGLLPIAVEEKGLLAGRADDRSVRPALVNAFTRQLASLLRSGVPILRALEILGRQATDRRLAVIITDIIVNLQNGRAFSACLDDHPRVFSHIYVTLVMAGEESGRLREMLLALCVYQKKQEEVARKVRGALTYPLFMLAVGVGTVFFVLTFVMPKLTVLFEGMRQGLPWPTRCVMAMSHAVRVAWPILAGIVFIGALAARFIFRTPEVRRRCGYFLAVIPWIRAVVLKVDLERFARTLGLLLESGIPLLKALEIAVPVIQDEALRRDMVLCQERVASGSSFGECLAESRNVPDLAVELIMVAEESGALSGALNDIAATYEDEINELTRAVTTLIEPLFVVIVGLVVGFIVFAMLMPIFQMDMFVS